MQRQLGETQWHSLLVLSKTQKGSNFYKEKHQMIIEILNYQPFYCLIGIRVFHILLLIPIIYLINRIRREK